MTILVKNGTVVSPTGAIAADVLIDGERIVALLEPGTTRLGVDLEASADTVIDAHGKYVVPGWRRRAHAHGAAVRRHPRVGHVRDRHSRGRVGRHDDDHRLRRATHRRARPGRSGGVARKGRRQLRDRLRLPPDHRRRRRRLAEGDGRARQRGHHELQAVHGLPRRLLLRRRPDPAGDADGGRQRIDDHDARRERHRDRRSRRRRLSRAARPHRATTDSRGRGRPRKRPPTERSCWRA